MGERTDLSDRPEAGRDRPDPLQWLVIGVFLLTACSVVIRGAWVALSSDLTWSGSIGPANYGDSMQYLAFIRDSTDHILAGNLYSLDPPARAFLHPGIAVSGLLVRLGLPVPLSYALWVPISALALAAAVFAFVRELTPRGSVRTAALALALLYSLPVGLADQVLGTGKRIGLTEAATAQVLWGYPYAALSVALLCVAIVRFSRAREEGRAIDPVLGGAALLVGWLQPWQGLTLLLVLVAGEALARLGGRMGKVDPGEARPRAGVVPRASLTGLVLPTLALASAPLAYYAWLGSADPSFRVADLNAALVDSIQTPAVLALALAPLLLPALLALRLPARRPVELAARVWPVAALFGALVLIATGFGSSPSHFLRGIAIPLAVLAAIGIDHAIGGRRNALVAATAAVALVALAGVGTVRSLQANSDSFTNAVGPGSTSRYWLSDDEVAALDFLDDPAVGAGSGVVASPSISPFVPWWSGLAVWQGNAIWTPRAAGRAWAGKALFSGAPCCELALLSMAPRRFASATGADVALVACSPESYSAAETLGPLSARIATDGCASLISLPPGTEADQRAVHRAYSED